MYLKDVEIFCEVASRRSFSKAAEAYNMSQSSASHAVSALERRLGKQLIDRSKRPLELTTAGQIYYEGCREMLRAFRAIEDRVQGMENRIAGQVRVAAIYSVGLLQMDALIRRFEQAYPDVDVRVEYRHPDEVYEAVRSGEAHLGLVSFPRDGGEFASIPWQEQEMVVVVPPTHRFAAAETVRAADLDGEDFVTFDSGLAVRRQIDRWLRSAGVTVNVAHAFDNVENAKRAVEIGAGIALLPQPTVLREVELGSLAAVPLADANWTRPLGIVHRRHKKLSAAARKFVEALRSEAGSPAEPASAGEPSAAGTV
ncbi:MAG TPA: LysR family transcriptional regulator [Planctomycetaceae bacterium]